MSAQQELIERLRHHASSAPVISRQSIDMDAAADRLASLSAENAALKEEVERLRGALEPFANLWLDADEDQRPSNPFYQRNEAVATYADLRRARAALGGGG